MCGTDTASRFMQEIENAVTMHVCEDFEVFLAHWKSDRLLQLVSRNKTDNAKNRLIQYKADSDVHLPQCDNLYAMQKLKALTAFVETPITHLKFKTR